jgi:DNA-binding response OmpR family regulator
MKDNAAPPARILVVEDETALAMSLEMLLEIEGYSVVGPIGRLDQALLAAESELLDAALLDINIVGGMVFPVAEALDRRGVPVLLVTGYDDRIMRKANKDWPRLMKPYAVDELLERLAALVGRDSSSAS